MGRNKISRTSRTIVEGDPSLTKTVAKAVEAKVRTKKTFPDPNMLKRVIGEAT